MRKAAQKLSCLVVLTWVSFGASAQSNGWTETGSVTSTPDRVNIGTWTGEPADTSNVRATVNGDLFTGNVGTSAGRLRLTSNANEAYVQWNIYYNGAGLKLLDQAKPGWDVLLSGINDRVAIRRYPAGTSYVAPTTLLEVVDSYDPAAPNVPRAVLTVNGGAQFNGKVRGTNIEAHYQDVAEWVPATRDLAPGTVVVLNQTKHNEVMASESAYDSAVAGVVSPAPGLILGESGDGKEMIATTGRVRVKVDARQRAIKVGDLLTTSDSSGSAMASEPISVSGVKIHRPGTILGKALEPLDSGTGEILVLLTLQ